MDSLTNAERLERRAYETKGGDALLVSSAKEIRALRALIAEAQDNICAAYCPSVKRTGEEWPHVDLCKRLKAES